MPRQPPPIFAPPTSALAATVVNDCIPKAVSLCLVIRCDLKRERLGMRKDRTAVEPESRNTGNGELDGKEVAFCATGKIRRRVHETVD